MDPRDNVNHPQVDEGKENSNPPQPLNINTQIDEGLAMLIKLVNELGGTRKPSRESLATSLDVIVRSITSFRVKCKVFVPTEPYKTQVKKIESR
jgi:hypothetical protein